MKEVPSYIKDVLPVEAQDFFMDVYNRTSLPVAWEATKSRFEKKGETIIVNSNKYVAPPDLFSFEMNPEETNIALNSESEEIIMDAVLADTNPNTDGKFFTEKELQELALQINTFGSTVPDVDHEKLIGLVKKYGRDHDAIMNELRKEKGIMSNIKASVEKGRLWIRATLDKRYKNHLEKFKALSIEAYADIDGNRFSNPKYLGFTFTNKPKLAGARIAI